MAWVAFLDPGKPVLPLSRDEVEGSSSKDILAKVDYPEMSLYVNSPLFSQSVPLDSCPAKIMPQIVVKEKPPKFIEPDYFLSVNKNADLYSFKVAVSPKNLA